MLHFLLVAALLASVPARAAQAPVGLAVSGLPATLEAPAVLPRQSVTAELTWQPVAGAAEYWVRVDSDDPQLARLSRDCQPHAVCQNHVREPRLSIPVQGGHMYRWWVHAVDEDGFSAPVHAEFHVGLPRPLGLTVNGAPAEPSMHLPPGTRSAVLRWQPVPGAREYLLRVDSNDQALGDPAGNDCGPHPICKDHLSAAEFTLSLKDDHSYTFWVHAGAPGAEPSDESAIIRFTVGSGDLAELPPPPGPYARPGRGPTFTSQEKILVTTHFYWYDKPSGLHTRAPDALQDEPVNMDKPVFSYKNPAWYEKELADMAAAGIDVMLPVYWGFPGGNKDLNAWSNGGLKTLEAAMKAVRARGLPVPKVGMFYDTSTLEANPHGKLDLRRDQDRRYFWGTIRDFFSLVPPENRARIDGKPVVFFYNAVYAQAYDQGAFDYLRAQFLKTFGEEPYLVPDVSWNVRAESSVQWGASLLGATIHGVAQIGAGADDTVLHRAEGNHIALREDGAYYARNWTAAAESGRNIVSIETWNEFHEGTDIAESKQYGTFYIALTHRFSNLWKGRRANATFDRESSRIPASVAAGAPFEARVAMRNTGDTAWSHATVYRLGSDAPQDNVLWGEGRIELAPGEVVPPGGRKVFLLRGVAPKKPGRYAFQWRMVQELIMSGGRTWPGAWFGSPTDALTIDVK